MPAHFLWIQPLTHPPAFFFFFFLLLPNIHKPLRGYHLLTGIFLPGAARIPNWACKHPWESWPAYAVTSYSCLWVYWVLLLKLSIEITVRLGLPDTLENTKWAFYPPCSGEFAVSRRGDKLASPRKFALLLRPVPACHLAETKYSTNACMGLDQAIVCQIWWSPHQGSEMPRPVLPGPRSKPMVFARIPAGCF